MRSRKDKTRKVCSQSQKKMKIRPKTEAGQSQSATSIQGSIKQSDLIHSFTQGFQNFLENLRLKFTFIIFVALTKVYEGYE